MAYLILLARVWPRDWLTFSTSFRLFPFPCFRVFQLPDKCLTTVKQFDTHCTPKENIVMETGGREAFVIERSRVNLERSRVNLEKMLSVLPV